MRAEFIALLWFLSLLSYEVSGTLDLHAGRKNNPPATNVKIIPKEIEQDADKAVKEVTPTSDKNLVDTIGNHIDAAIDTNNAKVESNVNDATNEMTEDTAPQSPTKYKHQERLLADSDLYHLNSIDCLEKAQRGEIDPKCSPPKKEKKKEEKEEKEEEKPVPQVYQTMAQGWWVGHYPHFKSEQCHGHGEHFCDPDGLLNETQRCKVAQELNRFARNHDVMCDVPGTGNQEKYPFFLGIALVKRLPDLLLDQNSMNHFGEGVLARWGLLEDRVCPNSAVIVIAAETHQASLASSSCEFICEERGGLGIEIRVRETLTMTGSPFKAALGGIAEFSNVLKQESPLYEMPGVGLPAKKPLLSHELTDKIDNAGLTLEELTGGYDINEVPASDKDRKDLATYLAHREGSYALVQRAVFGIIIGSAIVTLLIFCWTAFSGDVYGVYKRFQDDLTPEHVVPELIKGAPKWGYESASYGSFHDSH